MNEFWLYDLILIALVVALIVRSRVERRQEREQERFDNERGKYGGRA